MPNWTAITRDDLKAHAFGGVIDAAASYQAGIDDPVAEAISDAVSAVRGAISTGNALDADPTKVPNSLKSLTCRVAIFGLMGRIQFDLSEDQRATRQADQSRLNRISDQKVRFETPDNPMGSAEMQTGSTIDTAAYGNRGNDRRELRGL